MSELRQAQHMLDAAEEAATAGDLTSAEQLLRDAARIQEAELGPVHPDLANTMNNLAIVAEKLGRAKDAEACYRRGAAIASAALPPDHPLVAVSRQNLEDFCRARGLPIDEPAAVTPPAGDAAIGLEAFAPERPGVAADAAPDHGATDLGPAPLPSAAAADRHDSADAQADAAGFASATTTPPRTAASPDAHPSSLPRRGASRPLAWIAVSLIVLVTAVLLARQPWSEPGTSAGTPAAAPGSSSSAEPEPPASMEPLAPAPEPVEPAPVEPAPVEPEPVEPEPVEPEPVEPPPTAVEPRGDEQDAAAAEASDAASASRAATLTTVELCRSLSTSGASWRCEPAGGTVEPGPMVLYTRVRSARDTAVVHRWYRDDTLQSSVQLRIRANPAEGFRTYSRQTLDREGDWRVEVRDAAGDLLHEQRVAVR